MAFPPVIGESIGEGAKKGVFGRSVDPAKYVIERSRFERPTLRVPGGAEFIWPGGVEGIRVSGTIGNAVHKYIGDNADVVQVMHRDSRRVVMTGNFSGITGSDNTRELMEVITAMSPTGYWILKLPADVLPMKEWQVNIEDYDFDHPSDDRTDSWTYTISFIFIGVGSKLKPPKAITDSPTNPGTKKTPPKGKGTRIFTIHSGARTLRAVAQLVYSNPERWREIYNANQAVFDKLDIQLNVVPTKILPLGLKLHY